MRPTTPDERDTPRPTARASWGAGGFATAWLQILAAASVVGAMLAVSGAFGTGVVTVAPRFVFWLSLMAVGASLGLLMARFVVPRTWFSARPWLTAAVLALLISAPMSVVVTAANALMNHQPFRPARILALFPATLATTAGMTVLAYLVRRRSITETHAAPAGAPPPKFLERLPDKLKDAEVWAIEAEDHYLRLHTSKGQDLILMRLSDAVRELEGIEGAQTHRSWWVARDAVTATERGDGRATLTLKGGTMVPVSRAYAKTLREGGWF